MGDVARGAGRRAGLRSQVAMGLTLLSRIFVTVGAGGGDAIAILLPTGDLPLPGMVVEIDVRMAAVASHVGVHRAQKPCLGDVQREDLPVPELFLQAVIFVALEALHRIFGERFGRGGGYGPGDDENRRRQHHRRQVCCDTIPSSLSHEICLLSGLRQIGFPSSGSRSGCGARTSL